MIRVARWHGALVGALTASAVGLYLGDYTYFLVGIVVMGYVVYGQVTGLGPPSLDVERSVGTDRASPDEPVTVSLRVRNVGDRPIPDLRIVDGVPADVTVVEGSPAACVGLRPGEETCLTYDVLAPRGTHEFGAVAVRGRSLAGTVTGTATLAPDGAASLTCDTRVESVPLRDRTTPYVGPQSTDAGGEGIEFHAVREYRRGDPLSSIDWHRLARTGDLASVSYREERAAAVVLVLDVRRPVAVRPPDGGPPAREYVAYAAAQGIAALTDAGHEVGVATLTDDGVGEWIEPGRNDRTRAAVSDLLTDLDEDGGDATAAEPAPRASGLAADGAGTVPSTESGGGPDDAASDEAVGYTMALLRRLPADAQAILCTPLLDDVPIDVAALLGANRHDVTVLSPNLVVPSGDRAPTPGQGAAAIARETRVTALRGRGVPVADWHPDDPLEIALARLLTDHTGRTER